MARETKARKMARLAVQAAGAELDELRAAYQPRLMAALERVSNLDRDFDFNFKVWNGLFVVSREVFEECGWNVSVFRLSLQWSSVNDGTLDALESLLKELEFKQEAKRLAQVREAALAKLSEEERALLGL